MTDFTFKHKEQHEGKDYTLEISRCLKFIFSQMRKGLSFDTAYHQSVSSYGFSIAETARRAIERNLTK